MNVKLHLKSASNLIEYPSVKSTYVKGSFYCIRFVVDDDNCQVDKYPIQDIFRTTETYNKTDHGEK